MPLKECIIHRQYPTNECLFVRELFSIFITSCAEMYLADILKVFSHCPNLKMWQFSTNQGQRTALISCLDYGRNAFCVSIPHIYPSVGYCVVYLIRVCHNLQIDKRNQLHTFFF